MRHENRQGTFAQAIGGTLHDADRRPGRRAGQRPAPAAGVLIVGFRDHLQGRSSLPRVTMAELLAMEPARWARLAPDIVVTALQQDGQDACDIAANLHARGFTGALMVLAPPLPDPGMVRRELERLAPACRIVVRVHGRMRPLPCAPL